MLGWICYLLVVGALLAGVAWLVDHRATAARRARRWGWATALVALPVIGLGAAWAADRPLVTTGGHDAVLANDVAPTADRRVGTDRAVVAPTGAPRRAGRPWPASTAAVDTALVAAWGSASAIVAGTLLLGAWRLRRLRQRWRRLTPPQGWQVDHATVWATPHTGPATYGIVRPVIALPQAALALSADELAMVVAHERSHVEARDPALHLIALLVLVLLPWHPAVWWMRTRLGRAIELDCDARVIGGGADARAYGHLLVTLCERLARAARGGAAPGLVLPLLDDGRGALDEVAQRLRALRARPADRRGPPAAMWSIAAPTALLAAGAIGALPVPDRAARIAALSGASVAPATPDRLATPGVEGAPAAGVDPAAPATPVTRTPARDTVRQPPLARELARLVASDDEGLAMRRLFTALLDADGGALARAIPADDPFVWVAIAADGTVLGTAVGRAGLGDRAREPDGRVPLARATRQTPSERLVVDHLAFPARFPAITTTARSYGWYVLPRQGRTVNVLWALHAPARTR
jgi:Zn-dependent protease with chaperone function